MTSHATPSRSARHGLTGFVIVTLLAVLLIVGANAKASPAATQEDDGTNPTCDAASPAASPASTPETASSGGSNRIDRVVATTEAAAEDGNASQSASPTADPCLETPSGDDLLATAAALLAAATATAEAANAAEPSEAAPAATEAAPTQSAETGEITDALPAADIPSTNVQGYSFNLEASLSADLAAVQTEAPVYRLIPSPYDAATVTTLAAALGISGAVEDRGNGTFSASGNGELFVTPNLIQYLSPAQPGEGDLPDDATAVELARDWLRTSSLIQPDLGDGTIVSRDETTGRIVVVFTPVEPVGLLAAYPSINVSIGRGGVVLEVSSRWAAIQRSDLYQLRPSEEAWRQVESGQGYIETDLTGSTIEPSSVVSGLVTYDTIGLVYTTAGPPGDGQYLVPFFVFTGQLTPEGATQAFPVRAYVPALAISDTPVGFASSLT